jgi:F0F1-type ATP synthase assembly protein I
MKTNNCAEITDARNRGLTESSEPPQTCRFIIPAGILIGLGVGILFDQLASCFLIGLGLGFLGSGLFPLLRKPGERDGLQQGRTDVTMLLIGAFLVFIGISMVSAPAAFLSYAIAGFLILMGIWFLVREFYHIS